MRWLWWAVRGYVGWVLIISSAVNLYLSISLWVHKILASHGGKGVPDFNPATNSYLAMLLVMTFGLWLGWAMVRSAGRE